MVKNLPANAGDVALMPRSEKSAEEGNDNPLSSILAWEIPLTEEPSGPQSKASQRVTHNWASVHGVAKESDTT